MNYIRFLYHYMKPLIETAVEQECQQNRECYAAALSRLRAALGDDARGLTLDVTDEAEGLRDSTGEQAFAVGLRLGLSLSDELAAYALPDDYPGCCAVSVDANIQKL
jgi:hypothetical protein